jgi:hypothetical protein
LIKPSKKTKTMGGRIFFRPCLKTAISAQKTLAFGWAPYKAPEPASEKPRRYHETKD